MPPSTTEVRLHPEIKAAWLAALRSGEFVQAQRTLRPVNDAGVPLGHCCLGVLCELYVKAHPDVKWSDGQIFSSPPDSNTQPLLATSLFGRQGALPEPVSTWAGVGFHDIGVPCRALLGVAAYSARIRSIIDWRYRQSVDNVFLSELNDGGFSFAEIADVIEQYL